MFPRMITQPTCYIEGCLPMSILTVRFGSMDLDGCVMNLLGRLGLMKLGVQRCQLDQFLVIVLNLSKLNK